MSEDTAGGETAAVETTKNAAPEAALSSQETPERDYDADARGMGWVPEDDFKGDKSRWKDAKTFVEDGETILPIVRSQLKRSEEERKKDKEDFDKRIARSERMAEVALKREQERHATELASIKQQKRDAVAAGDTATFDALEKQEESLKANPPEADEKPAKELTAEDNTRQWAKDNTWFNDDFGMTKHAIEWSQWNAEKNPNISFEDNMKALDKEMRKTFPQKFSTTTTPAANAHAAVDSGGAFTGIGRKAGKTFADLPREAKEAGARYVDQKLFKDKEAYAKEYWANE